MSWPHLSDTTPKARKQYRCDICNEVIEVGEMHVARRGIRWNGSATVRAIAHVKRFGMNWNV
jgi:hypothetical protein